MLQIENGKQFERLLRFWPQTRTTDDVIQTYGEALANQHPEDVRMAIDDFIFGKVAARNNDFIPQPGALSAQIHKRRNERIDHESRLKPRGIALPPPSKPYSAEERKELITRLLRPFREAFEANKAALSPEKLDAQKQAFQKKELFNAAMAGDDAALAKLTAENASISLSNESRKQLGISLVEVVAEKAVA